MTAPAKSLFAFSLYLVALGLAPRVLILFGAVDLLFALWTALALRADSRAGS